MSDAFADAQRALRRDNAAGADALKAEYRAQCAEAAELARHQRAAHVHACSQEITVGEVPAQLAVALHAVDWLFIHESLSAEANQQLSTIRMLLLQASSAVERWHAEAADLDTSGPWDLDTVGTWHIVSRESDGKRFKFRKRDRAQLVKRDLGRGLMSFETARRLEALDAAQAA